MQRIVPNIWLNDTAEAAAELYMSAFPDTKVLSTSRYPDAGKEIHGHDEGKVLTIVLGLNGYRMLLLNGGPNFTPNPSLSFFYNGDTKEIIDAAWAKLAEGGKVLMELGEYPFSEYYGWVEDKYGVSWQLMLAPPLPLNQRIVPALLFTGEVAGKAQEAMDFYIATFEGSTKGTLAPYGEGMEPEVAGTLSYGEFMLFGNEKLVVMDSARDHKFAFTEGVSLAVTVDDQATIDQYWSALSAVPEAEACGWLKDKYGVSWQIVPSVLEEYLTSGTPEQSAHVTNAFMQMKKFDIAALKAAFDGNEAQ